MKIEIKTTDCEICGKKDVIGLIRTKPICDKCIKIIRRDNLERLDAGIDIPPNMEILQKTRDRLKKVYSENSIYNKINWKVYGDKE
jgi:hypothetical protein